MPCSGPFPLLSAVRAFSQIILPPPSPEGREKTKRGLAWTRPHACCTDWETFPALHLLQPNLWPRPWALRCPWSPVAVLHNWKAMYMCVSLPLLVSTGLSCFSGQKAAPCASRVPAVGHGLQHQLCRCLVQQLVQSRRQLQAGKPAKLAFWTQAVAF